MEQRHTAFEQQSIHHQMPIHREPLLPFPVVPHAAVDAAPFVRTHCSFCRRSFVLDVEMQWSRPPEEMELEGRRFLGIQEDSSLCPECVADVEVAGAERLYWALSQTL